MNAYVPKRRSRGEGIIALRNLPADLARWARRDIVNAGRWLRLNGVAVALIALVAIATAITADRIAQTYAPNATVPFLPVASAGGGQ